MTDNGYGTSGAPTELFDPVRRLMSRPVVFADGEVTLRDVAGIMAGEGVGAVVLLGPEGPSMLVTERDVVRALADGVDPDVAWGADIASLNLATVDPDDTVLDAARAMVAFHVRHLPVTARGEVVGMVSARDVIRALVGAQRS